MSEVGLAAAVLLASLTLTYLFCLRPMRHGHCVFGAGRGQRSCFGEVPSQDVEVAQLRQEVAALRAEMSPMADVE